MNPAVKRAAFVAGWMAARIYYGPAGEVSDGEETPCGAECATVQGPYMCTCSPDQERSQARWAAEHRYPE